MNTRLTIDLGDPRLLTLLRLESAHAGKALREIVIEALKNYFSNKNENRILLKMAEKTFAEWDNPQDSEYDKL